MKNQGLKPNRNEPVSEPKTRKDLGTRTKPEPSITIFKELKYIFQSDDMFSI